MITSPCYRNGVHCKKRQVGCHARCKEYQDWSRERNRMLDAAYLDKQTDAVEIECHEKNRRAFRRRKR